MGGKTKNVSCSELGVASVKVSHSRESGGSTRVLEYRTLDDLQGFRLIHSYRGVLNKCQHLYLATKYPSRKSMKVQVFPSIVTRPKLYGQFPTSIPVAAPFRSERKAKCILFFVAEVARIIIAGIKLGYLVPRYNLFAFI